MFEVLDFKTADYEAVLAIDVATQREYRGPAWDAMDRQAQSRLLMTSDELVPFYEESAFSLIAKEDGLVLGFLFAMAVPRGRLIVDAIAVRKEARRRGVGKALYARLLAKARSAGIGEVSALISVDNPQSMRLHESSGFLLRPRVEAVISLLRSS